MPTDARAEIPLAGAPAAAPGPVTFGLAAQQRLGGARVLRLSLWRDQEALGFVEFTPRQWMSLVRRGSAVAEEIMREGETP